MVIIKIQPHLDVYLVQLKVKMLQHV